MQWYKGIVIFLGCTALKGMDKTEEGMKPQTEKERLIQAINKVDILRTKQSLARMKGKIAQTDKAELVEIARQSNKKCSDEISLAQSKTDSRSFGMWLGAAAVTGALSYVCLKRAWKKSQVAIDRVELEKEKNLIIAEEVIGELYKKEGLAIPTKDVNQMAEKAKFDSIVQKAVAKEKFSDWLKVYNYHHALDMHNLVNNARNNWDATHGKAYRKKDAQYEEKELDYLLSTMGGALMSSLFVASCKRAFDAFTCPSACEKSKRAADIEETLKLIEAL